jgi:NAD(P)-dependent dehydrogenase (short-subunit alcohol dehydrogenase family)
MPRHDPITAQQRPAKPFTPKPSPHLGQDNVKQLAPGPLFDLSGRGALVTGAAGGIGRWLAAGLAAAGADVAITDVNAEGLADVEQIVRSTGVTCVSLAKDLAGGDAAENLVHSTVTALGRLDILVNCAGINRRQPILHTEPAAFDDILAANLRAPYFLSRSAARQMMAAGSAEDERGGTIIHIGSVNSAQGLEDVSVYGPAKAALSQLTKVQAIEWARFGIRVNCLAPGFMLTPLSESLWRDTVRAQWILARVPLRRPGVPRELVGMTQLLASHAGSFITGQTFFIDGGFLAGSSWRPEADDK